MLDYLEAERSVAERASKRPEQGVSYRLRVIKGSGGLLELVEERPRLTWFQEWARAMHMSGTGGWGY